MTRKSALASAGTLEPYGTDGARNDLEGDGPVGTLLNRALRTRSPSRWGSQRRCCSSVPSGTPGRGATPGARSQRDYVQRWNHRPCLEAGSARAARGAFSRAGAVQ